MGLTDMMPFISGGTSGMSVEELRRRQAAAAAVASQKRKFPTTLGEGMTYLGEAVGERMEADRLREAEVAQAALDRGAPVRPGSYRGGGAAAAPAPAPAPAGRRVPTERIAPDAGPAGVIPGASPAVPAGTFSEAPADPLDRITAALMTSPQEVAQMDPTQGVQQAPPMDFLLPGSQSDDGAAASQYRNAIGGIESSNDYSAVGVPTKYGRAHGRYGVIEANIPKWTAQVLGQAMTPQEFLKNEKAQDAVFDAKFGEYVAKYGPEKAARAWYGGEGNINNLNATDTHEKLSVHDYGRDFLKRLRGKRAEADEEAPAPIQLASLGGAGGTMTDAPPVGMGGSAAQPRPSVAPEEPDPTVVDGIRPMSAPNQMAQIGPEMFSPRRMSDAPVAMGPNPVPLPAVPRAPTGPPGTVVTDIKPAPNLPASRTPIPGAKEQEMPDPGAEPQRPARMGPSPAAEDNWRIWNDPRYTPERRTRAKEAYQEEERFRLEIQNQQQETYKDQRERWQAKRDAKDKFDREAHDRTIEQLTKRLGAEQAQVALEKAYFERGIPRQQAIDKAALEIKEAGGRIEKQEYERTQRPIEERGKLATTQKTERDVTAPRTTTLQGAEYQSPYDPKTGTFGPLTRTPGGPDPEEKALTAEQAEGVRFVLRTKTDLEQIEKMDHGKVLTEASEALRAGVPGVGNVLASEKHRAATNKLGNWAGGFLKLTSGAAVTPSEAMLQLPAFIPMVGDDAKELEEKSRRRREFTEAVEKTTGARGLEVIRKGTEAVNEEYLESKKPPVSVSSPDEARAMEAAGTLKPGRKLLLPDGRTIPVPRR